MKNKIFKSKYFFAIFILIFLIWLAIMKFNSSSKMVLYVPVVRHNSGELEYDQSLLTKEHKILFLQTLFKYHVEFFCKDGNIYIKNSLFKDMDLLANYTGKSYKLEDE